ncbi:hypothetical protein J6590_016033, partial [Homalodisca vitripennis]
SCSSPAKTLNTFTFQPTVEGEKSGSLLRSDFDFFLNDLEAVTLQQLPRSPKMSLACRSDARGFCPFLTTWFYLRITYTGHSDWNNLPESRISRRATQVVEAYHE